MSYLPNVPEWAEGVYQLERNDPVSGGPLRIDEKGKERGTANKPLIDLANRTAWLKEKYDTAFDGLGWMQLGLWAVGLEVSLPTQIVSFDGSWYRYRGNLDVPHVIAGESPEEDGGVWSGDNPDGVWVDVGEASLRLDLSSLDEDKGTFLVKDRTGKNLQDALIVKVENIDELRELKSFSGAVSEITTTGRRGLFKFIASDLSDPVLLDTAAGVFVAPASDLSGASGAWVRQCFANELGVPANGEFVCVDWFGADNSGDSYSSDAIRAAFTFHSYVEFSGKYKYSGAAIDPSYGGFRIVGNDSELRLDAGVVFIDFTGTIRNPDVRDLRIYGGETQITFENATNNTFYENRVFKNVSFFDYTKIGLRITDRDCPYWVVEECVFAGLTAVGTIGLWDNSSDTNVVSKCKFLKNQIHLSAVLQSGMYSVTENDFIQTAAGDESSPRASIWYRIPTTVPTYTGNIGKHVIERNKFGNENLRSYDTKLLFANVASDSHLPDFVNYSGEPKTCNLYLRENTFAFAGAYPSHFSRSVGPFIPYDTFISGCNMTPGLPSGGKYVFYFDNVGAAHIFSPHTVWIDTVMQRDAGSQYPLHNFTNADTFVRLMAMNDIDILTAGMPIVHSPLSWHGGVKTDVTTDILPSILTSGSVTTAAGVDSLGGAEARVVTITGSSHAVWQKMTVPTLTDAIWCQGELKLDDSVAEDFVYIRVAVRSTGASPRTYATIIVKVYKRWSSFCFPVNAKTDSGYANWQIMYEMFNQSTYPVTFHVGKSRAYRSKTPQPMGTTRFDSLLLSNVPTSSAGLPSGAVWSDGGVLKIVL